MVQVRASERSDRDGERVCPLCRDALGDAHQACKGCETEYHGDCLAELGGCSTLGCTLHGKLPDSFDTWFCRGCHRPLESDLTRRRCPCGAYLHDGCIEAHRDSGCARAVELWRGATRDTASTREHLAERWHLPKPPAEFPHVTLDDRNGRSLLWLQAAHPRPDAMLARGGLGLLAFVATLASLWFFDHAGPDAGLITATVFLLCALLAGVAVIATHRVTALSATPTGLWIVSHSRVGQFRRQVRFTAEQAAQAAGSYEPLRDEPRLRLRIGREEFMLSLDERQARWVLHEVRMWGQRQLASR